MTNTELLNNVKNFIIETSNENGIIPSEAFGSRVEFMNFVVGLKITHLVGIGFDVKGAYDLAMGDGAYDLVMGDGAYKQLSDDVWASLQSP